MDPYIVAAGTLGAAGFTILGWVWANVWRTPKEKDADIRAADKSERAGLRTDIDALDSKVTALSLTLASDYHDRDAVRQLIGDLLDPIKMQLSRLEGMLQLALGLRNSGTLPLQAG